MKDENMKHTKISLIIIEIPINIIAFDVMLGYLSAKLSYLKIEVTNNINTIISMKISNYLISSLNLVYSNLNEA